MLGGGCCLELNSASEYLAKADAHALDNGQQHRAPTALLRADLYPPRIASEPLAKKPAIIALL